MYGIVGADPPQPASELKATPEVQALLDQARQAIRTSHNDLATNFYDQALNKARELKDLKGQTEALRGLGNLYYSAGQFQKAIEDYQQALTIASSSGDKVAAAGTLNNLGNIFFINRQHQKALEYYQQALEAQRAAGNKSGEAKALYNLGSVYFSIGSRQKALEYYQAALPLLHALDQRQLEANVLMNLGEIYRVTGRPQQALEYFEPALAACRAIGDKSGEATALRSVGEIYRVTGRPQQALEFLQQSLTVAHASGNKADEGGALVNIGSIYLGTGQPQKALEYYQQALPILRAVGARQFEANALLNIGTVYRTTGQPQQGLDYDEQALTIYRAIGDQGGVVRALGNIGLFYRNTGQLQKALEVDFQVLPVLRALGDKGAEATALNNICVIYRATGQQQKAMEYGEQARALYHVVGDKQGQAGALLNIGSVCQLSGQFQQALEYYHQSLALFRVIGDKQGEASSLGSIGGIYTDTNQPQKALKAFQQTLAVFHIVGDQAGQAYALTNIGNVFRRIGQPMQALENYQQALSLCRAIGDKDGEAAALTGIGYIESAHQNLSNAALHYDQAIALTEQLRANLGGFAEAKSRYLQSNLARYYGALRVHLQLHHEARAFAVAQQTKARVLLDLMASGRVDLSRDLTEEERQQLQSLRQRADFLNQQMVKEGVQNEVGAKQRFADLQLRLRQTEGQLQTLTDTLYARYPVLAAKAMAKTATLADMAASLPLNTALLEYVATSGQQVTLFVVRQQAGRPTLHIYSLPIDYNDLLRQATRFRASCADLHSPYQSQARQLYTRLIAPAEPALSGASHLVICPDQALWELPFAALLLPDGRFLADRCRISYAYSATGLLAAQTLRSAPNRATPTGTLLALANPEFGEVSRLDRLKGASGVSYTTSRPFDVPSRPFDVPSRPFDVPSRPFDVPSRPFDVPSRPFDVPSRPFDAPSRPFDVPSRPFDAPSRSIQAPARQFLPDARTLPELVRGKHLAPLPGTQAEADALAKLFPDAAIYTGAKAQEQVVKQEAGKYRYLHFATHGFCNDTDPMLSSIVLAAPPKGSDDDGFLTAREIAELSLNAELVVLSACNTARGEERSGEGVIGLSWALLAAGCPSEVVSQWSVSDASTATLMAEFYAGLKAGKGKAAALQAAGKKLRANGNHSHPYYWAPFILLGDGR
jgi:CHAT domain-containing protein/Tfp pilus assembly protein PilF